MCPVPSTIETGETPPNPDMFLPGMMYEYGMAIEDGYHAFSNDGTIPLQKIPQLKEQKDGIALHIGAGAAFSLIDYHGLQPVIVDYDSVTIKFQQLVGTAIAESDTVEAALEQITRVGAGILSTAPQYVRRGVRQEASSARLGKIHWTKHYHEVQAAVRERPPIYVVSDIREERLKTSLDTTSDTAGPIKFFNPTNVHNHLDGEVTSMKFLKRLPFARTPELSIIFSDVCDAGYSKSGRTAVRVLNRKVSKSLADYISYTDRCINKGCPSR